jgi:hypothetical protein
MREFVLACILLGCDYGETHIKGLGAQRLASELPKANWDLKKLVNNVRDGKVRI